jgi:hypothetical protein
MRQTLAAILCGSFGELTDFGLGFLFAVVNCFFRAGMLSPFNKDFTRIKTKYHCSSSYLQLHVLSSTVNMHLKVLEKYGTCMVATNINIYSKIF